MKTYGYARISTKTQSLDRQITNIKNAYPDACVLAEAFTGAKLQGRKALDRILNAVKPGDTIVFDSASRMSRNAAEAVALYEEMYQKGVNLVFLKEPHINSDVYREKVKQQIEITGNTGSKSNDFLLTGLQELLNQYNVLIAKEQVEIVFNQAQKELDDNHQRTSETIREIKNRNERIRAGLEDGRLVQIGQKPGAKLTTKKSIEAKEQIKKYSKDFDGTLNDPEVIKLTGISRNSFYKYKRELREEIAL